MLDHETKVQMESNALKYKIDSLESSLDSSLDVLWRRGDEEARTWIWLNYPKTARKFAIALIPYRETTDV